MITKQTDTDKARAILANGWVRLTRDLDGRIDGGSVDNKDGMTYRVDFDLGGREHCQCRGFEFHGHCKHLAAVYMAQARTDARRDARRGTPEGEPTDDELAQMYAADDDAQWAMRQEFEERLADLALDAGLDSGDYGSAAYALAW